MGKGPGAPGPFPMPLPMPRTGREPGGVRSRAGAGTGLRDGGGVTGPPGRAKVPGEP
ncbi:hypothetical protein GCM10014719_23310 [Planomonospora parontospora subsp. antibiotica]|nr:hypothetical protein GCM10014719_23310 [Planomonospora parontospora subsp. antibiotica]GII13595.1 hypothetical protein Ppa05_03210 [Planomonospora parontospora subsp. antibiotica]